MALAATVTSSSRGGNAMLKGFQASGFQSGAFQIESLVVDWIIKPSNYVGQITKTPALSYAVITKAKTLSVTELITKAGS